MTGYGKFRPIKNVKKRKAKPSYVSFRTGEQGWHRPQIDWNPSTRQLKGLAIIFLIVAGVIGADQVAKILAPNSPLNPVAPYDPFTLLWNGTVTQGSGQGNTVMWSNTNAPTNEPVQNAPLTRFAECFNGPGPSSSQTLNRFTISLKRVGSPTGFLTGRVWDNGIAGPGVNHNCIANSLGWTDSSSPTVDLPTVPTTYTTYTFNLNAPVAPNFQYAAGVWLTCSPACDGSNYVTAGISNTAPANQNAAEFNGISGWSCADPTLNVCPTGYDYQFSVFYGFTCASGYNCIDSSLTGTSNIMQLAADSTSQQTLDSFHPAVDSMFSTCNGTAFASFYGETFTASRPFQINTASFLMNKTNTWTGGIVAQIWNVQGSPGTTGIPLGTQPASGGFPQGALVASIPITDSTVMPTNSSATPVTFTFTTGSVLQKGNYVLSLTENSTLAVGASPLIGKGLASGCHTIVNTEVKKGATFAGHNGFLTTGGTVHPFNDQVVCSVIPNNICDFWFTVTALPVSAVALTSSPIDVSTSASKELFFYETWHNTTLLSVASPWGWYLTTNATLPTQSLYNPLNDPNVVMANLVYPNVGATLKNYYEYLAKTGDSQSLLASSGSGTNPYPNCPQTATLYMCAGAETGASSTNFFAISTTLNYTGTALNTANNGYSLFCIDTTPVTNPPASAFCSSSTQTPTISPCSGSQVICATTTLPFLNMQSGPYYLGFWSGAGQTATIQFGTSNSGAAAQRANSVWYWVPNPPPAVSPPPTIDTGGFFGPLIKALLGIGVWIVANIISFVTFLSSVIAPFLAAVFSVLIAVLQAELNALGGFFGWGNIGDQFISFASGIITYFTTGLSDALGWLIRLILRAIDLIKIANFWVNFYLTGLLNVLADGLNVIQFVVRIGTTITTFLGSSYVLILVMFFLWYDADMGVAGWHAWFETTKWFAFISFDFLERMINFGISSITWIIGRIPTMDGTTLPELPTIAIGGGPIWPSTDMTALREGNVFALFGQLIGVVFLVWFESSGLPGSIGANVPGSVAGNMAPFVTPLLIFVAIMGIVFVVSIPANLVRGTFGLNDAASNVLAQARKGVLTGGQGVSGRFVKKHPGRKLHIQITRGLGAGGLRPHLRKPQAKYTGTVGPNIN
jgi:hypothetical protein